MSASAPSLVRSSAKIAAQAAVVAAGVIVLAALVWQGITSSGSPDPTAEGISPAAMVLNTGIMVFREGLEAILILAALTASLARSDRGFWKPVDLARAFPSWPAWRH